MRSTPWTSAIPSECRYELRDECGLILGSSGSYAEGVRMLQAYLMTQPGRQDYVELCSLSASGQVIAREDIFDIELTR